MNDIREFTLNNTCFKETIFNGYYITQNGDIAQIKFNKNGKLKKFLLMEHEITKNGYHRIEINNKHYFIVICPQYEKEKNIINIVGRKLMNINRLSKR